MLIQHHGCKIRDDFPDADKFAVDDVLLKDGYGIGSMALGDVRVVVDIGAHIGAFSLLAHRLFPHAKIVAVECCPENIECLAANVGEFATVVQAACTYDTRPLALFNTVLPSGTLNSQASHVFAVDDIADERQRFMFYHWLDRRPIKRVTLLDILRQLGENQIDLLKLDCEGSEYSILRSDESRLARHVVGEWHDTARWGQFCRGLRSHWHVRKLATKDDYNGLFQLENKARCSTIP